MVDGSFEVTLDPSVVAKSEATNPSYVAGVLPETELAS